MPGYQYQPMGLMPGETGGMPDSWYRNQGGYPWNQQRYPVGTPPYADTTQYPNAGQPGMTGKQAGQQASQIGGQVIKQMTAKALPTGIKGFGTGAGGTLGSIASIGGGGLMAGQGIYDMIKAKDMKSNVIGGLKGGAGVGTMIMPGVGTAIGAGAGALAGWIKGRIQNRRQDMHGRQTQQELFSGITQGASQNQLGEAQNISQTQKGWTPGDALAHVVMRDHFVQQGMPLEMAQNKANEFIEGMWKAEKKGSDAVRAAAPNPMQKYF